jgi:hypothetical protein
MNHLEDFEHIPISGGYPLGRTHNVKNIEISGSYMSAVLNVLKRLLSGIECLNYRYDVCDNQSYMPHIDPYLYIGIPSESYDFEVEYGAIPKVKTLTLEQVYAYGKMRGVLTDVCESAIKKFPHNAPEKDQDQDQDPLSLLIPDDSIRKWCMTTINLYEIMKDDGQTVISIDFSLFAGDHWTCFGIYHEVASKFEAELLWETRRNYMAAFEGCSTADGSTAKYAFDEYVAREICTFDAPTVHCSC